MSDVPRALSIEMLRIGDQMLRVGYRAGTGRGIPLVLFNGIGASLELLEPLVRRLPRRELVTFDIPGVGDSPLPRRPYRLSGIAALGAQVLDQLGRGECDALGVSWGGAVAQQFARNQPERCRRLILCATAPGVFMLPGKPGVLLKLATPRRFASPEYARRICGEIYGGDFRRDPGLAAEIFRGVRSPSCLGYYLQLAASAGWTSIHWLHALEQPTLVMAGMDDPIVPLPNARLMCGLIPDAELKVLDCGHLFLLTRPEQSARAIEEFLSRP